MHNKSFDLLQKLCEGNAADVIRSLKVIFYTHKLNEVEEEQLNELIKGYLTASAINGYNVYKMFGEE